MHKKLSPIPPTAKVKRIPGTKYVLIDGDKLARLLTPDMRDDGVYYSVLLKHAKKAKATKLDDIIAETK